MWSDATSLSIEQEAAVNEDAARLCIMAGPGAGKTRVLTRRITRRVLSGETPPGRIVALTFTRSAALEMTSRLSKLDVHGATTATFHGLGLRFLARRYADGIGPRPNLVPRSQICRRLLEDGNDHRVTARQLDDEVGWATARMVRAGDYVAAATAARRSLPVRFSDMAELIDAYQRLKTRRGVIDFDDLLLLPLEHLALDREWAAAVRWQYRHFYVDEYQDTSLLQFELLLALLGDDADACVVGDPRQSIFGFAGAQAGAFDAFRERFPDTRTIELTQNFRSDAAIVAAGNRLTQTGMKPQRETRPGAVVIQAYTNPDDEARAIAQALKQAGPPWSDQAVLARTHRALDLVEAALLEAQIPSYRPQDILKRPEVRWVCRELKKLPGQMLARSARDDLVEIANEVGTHYSGGSLAEESYDGLDSWEDTGATTALMPTASPLELMLVHHHLGELESLLDEYVITADGGTLDGFFFWLEATARESTATRAPVGTVDLRPIHRAKGLEWRNVYLVGCTASLMPLEYSADETEELRLMFVAVTRATDKLVCTWSMNGLDRKGRPMRQEPSRYLARIDSADTTGAFGPDCSRSSVSDLAAETIDQARACLAGMARKAKDRSAGRPWRAPSASRPKLGRGVQVGFDEASALSAMAARVGTSVDELQSRIQSDERLRAEARILLAAARHLSVASEVGVDPP